MGQRIIESRVTVKIKKDTEQRCQVDKQFLAATRTHPVNPQPTHLVLGNGVDDGLQLRRGVGEELRLAHYGGDDKLVHELVVQALGLHDVCLGLLVHVRVLLQPRLHLLLELLDLSL